MVTAAVQYSTIARHHLAPAEASTRYVRAVRLTLSLARAFRWRDLGPRVTMKGHITEVGLDWHHTTGRLASHVFWPHTQDGLFVLSLAPKSGIIPATMFITRPGPAALRAYAEVLCVLSRLNGPLFFDGRLFVIAEPALRVRDLDAIARTFGLSVRDAERVFADLQRDGLLRRALPEDRPS